MREVYVGGGMWGAGGLCAEDGGQAMHGLHSLRGATEVSHSLTTTSKSSSPAGAVCLARRI